MSRTASNIHLLKEISRTGGCVHPIRLRGEVVNAATGEVNERSLLLSCKDRRRLVCPSCSDLYKADAWILVSAGLIGGKGVPPSVRDHPRLFLTLTAPSFGAVHTRRANGTCRPERQSTCGHGTPLSCVLNHVDDDPNLGAPLCERCFDYRNSVLWNATASRLWNRTLEQVRRRLAISQGLETRDFNQHARLSYLKVAEFQRRGLVHFHVVLRADGAGETFSPPPSWLTSGLLSDCLIEVVSKFSITTPNGEVRWGRQFHVSDASLLDRDDLRIAGYLAKYATKTTDGTLDFARRFPSRAVIARSSSSTHLRQLALTAWDLSFAPNLNMPHLRAHAHTFGFTGQLITKSRSYSTRFGDLRAVRAAFMASEATPDAIIGKFAYDGRGYDDPRGAYVAELLHAMVVDARREVRSASSTEIESLS